MYKIVVAVMLLSTSLIAEKITLTPYSGLTKYDNDTAKSLKDNARYGGLYANIGTLNYLVELSYNYMNITYKDNNTIEDLIQQDFFLKYGAYFDNSSYKIGLHAIVNNEQEKYRDLGNGYIGIIGVDGYNFFGYDKLTYGIDVYYSLYLNAHTDISRNALEKVFIGQVTPHMSYYTAIGIGVSNTISLKANFIAATQYQTKKYISYEIEDTVYYNSLYATLRYRGGEMKSGVSDGGLTVYNNKDLLGDTYSMKLGYYLTPSFRVDATASMNKYQEYDAVNLNSLEEGYNMSTLLSFSYSF